MYTLYNQFEMSIMEWFFEIGNSFLTTLFNILTNLGGSICMVGLIGIIYWCIDKEKGEKIAISIITITCVNGLLKTFTSRSRPFEEPGKSYINKAGKHGETSGSSFPSGHSQLAGGLYTMISLNFKKKIITILCILAILLVGISRLYLGVHWPSDVIIGILIGVILAIFFNYILTRFNEKKKLIYLLLLVILLPLTFFNVEFDCIRSYGLLAGVIGGILVENKFICFENSVSLSKKLLRILIGLLIVGGVYLFINNMPEEPTNYYLLNNLINTLCYGLIGFLTTGVVPLVFKNKFNKNGI